MSSSDETHSEIIHAYLAGTATEEQTVRLETLMQENPDFRSLFEAAEAKLHKEFETLEPISPPTGLIETVMDQVGHTTTPAVPTPQVHAGPEPWRTISIISSLAAAVAIGFLIAPSPPQTSIETRIQAVAFLQGDTESGLAMALYDPKTNQLLARFANIEVAGDQVQQLWLVRDGAENPISLGIIEPPAGAKSFSIDIEEHLQPGKDTLAVSLEPPGGSPQSGPSGPVVLAGIVEVI